MADAHHTRAHAKWAASSTARNWACSGALALSATVEQLERESEAAAWGTSCHVVSEDCLLNGREPDEWIGRFVTTKDHKIEVDEEMAETAAVYVNYVRGRMAEYEADTGDKAVLYVEKKFSLAGLNPPFEAGGTGDAVLIFPKWKLLEIDDLKGGRGVVVEAKGNKQGRTYALGAMLAFPGLDIDRVRVGIIQPRAPHKDGRVRHDEFHVADLAEWTSDLLDAMRKAKEAEDCFDQPSRAVWASKWLTSGGHCTFCPATAICPKREQEALDAAQVWFDDQDKPHIGNQPDQADPAKAAATLDMLDMIEDWSKAYRAYWHTQAEMGVEVPGYILVPKQGREKWKDDSAALSALSALTADTGLYLNPGKLRTPKQVRDALKKAGVAADLADLSEVPETGTNLVKAEKTSRPAAKPKAQQFFNVID